MTPSTSTTQKGTDVVPERVASRDPVRAAMLRLAASRAHLQRAMTPTPRRSFASARESQGAQGLDAGAWLAAMREYVSQWAIPRAALDALSQMWAQHPLREGGELALDEAQRLVVPLVRRHPVAAVGLAAGAGVLLVVAKPWRWLIGPLKAMPRDASRWVSAQLSQPAVQTAIAGFLMSQLTRSRRPSAPSTATATATMPPDYAQDRPAV